MKKGKNILVLLLLLFLVFNSLGAAIPAASAESSDAPWELSLPANLTDWIMDEEAGYIYAISSAQNSLYFIRLSDLKIEKTLDIGSNPSYLARDGRFLQVVLSGEPMIKTVDLSAQEVSYTVNTTGTPDAVAATSTYLIYSTGNGNVYKYDKLTRESGLLFYDPFISPRLALAVDEPSNTLYIGQLWSYAGLTAYNIETGKKLSETNEDDMEIGGSSYSIKHIFIDEKFAYFGGHQFNKQNLAETTGTYTRTDSYAYLESVILGISEDYVITTQGVFDKETYMPLAVFPTEYKFALLDSHGHAYLAGIANWYDEAQKIVRKDVALKERATAHFIAKSYWTEGDREITDWTTTDNSPYIYAVIAETNELIVINKDDLSMVKKMFIGSGPAGIRIFNNKIYINFKGENHINIIDLQNGIPLETAVSKITTKYYPNDVLPDFDNRILYDSGVFAGGLSVTSAVYTSVKDSVYNEISTWITDPDSYVLDPNKEILYGADTFTLYKYNSRNFEVIERNDIESGYYDSKLVLDEGNIYFGNRRYDANDSKLYGTYPERVIYARGNLVFSHTAVYERESFAKSLDLLMFIQRAYVDADDTVFVSTDKRIYRFKNLEELKTVMSATRTPSNAIVVDDDLNPGMIDGYLYLEPPANQEGIENYAAYYLDRNGNRLKQIGIFKEESLSTDTLFVFNLSSPPLPSEAVSVGVYPVIRSENYGSDGTLSVYATATIYDAPDFLPVNFSVKDTNPDSRKFKGEATWQAGRSELPGARYTLYFISAEGLVGEAIATVDGGQKSYSVTIPEKIVPEDVLGLAVITENDDFVSPLYSRAIFEDKVTSDVEASSVTVVKYMVQSDKVIIKNVLPNDTIRVYNQRLGKLMGFGIVEPNKTTITITISNLGYPGDKLYITRQVNNRMESMGTLVIVPSITDDRNGTGDGNGTGSEDGNGTDNGNGSGTDNGSGNGTGVSGSTGGGAVASEEVKNITTIKENMDGTRSSLTDVSNAFVMKAITDSGFKSNPVITIKADEKTATQSSQFQIDPSLLESINSNAKDAVLVLESANGKLQLAVNSLYSAALGSGSAQKLVISIAQASGNYKTKLNTQLSGSSSILIGGPVEYEIRLSGGGQERVLSNFSDYVNHVMTLHVAQNKQAVYSGLTYDPVTQTYVPVPTTWEWKDGVLQVTMKRKGNSVYTVVQNQAQFKDLNNSSAYKDSILALANRNVINGYADGSFKPETVVTRAEFAAMLNRALGILPKQQASKSFKDVQSGAWYAVQVNAAVDAGLINGFTDGTFRPDQEITHQEMVVMLVNALQYSGTSIKGKAAQAAYPANLPEWVKPYYVLAQDSGILQADSPFQFQTGKKTERQESAVLLYQLMKVLKLTNE